MPDSVRCTRCGQYRPARLAASADRPPCSNCGATNITIAASFRATATATATVLASLRPADQSRGWQRRWQDIEHEAAELRQPLTMPMTSAAIHAAGRRLQSFYVIAYHLKDDLRRATRSINVSTREIEQAIDADADLALLADLANLIKHGDLSDPRHPPRSGGRPVIISCAGTDIQNGGWRIDLVIQHSGRSLDGLQIAQRSVDAWRRALQRWHLI